MIKILDNFTHERGMHCDTTALRDVFAYAGNWLPEAALFGLGGGLSFFCWKGGRHKYPRIGGRIKPLEIDRRVCANLGVGLSIHTSTSPVRALDTMRKMLAQDKPIMMHTDVYYLKYAKADYHFGAHNIVVAGLDEAEDVAYVADYMTDGLIRVPVPQLMEARSSTQKPFPPKNRWFEFDFPGELSIDGQLIMRIISRNSLEMLNSYIRNLGIGGIYYFSTTLRSLDTLYNKKEIDAICDDAYFSIESSDTGGGCFRGMYADFLLYAYEETGVDRLKGISDGYRQASRMWSLAARMLKDVKCECVSLEEAADMINMIAAKEQELMTDLLCVSNHCCKKY